MHGNKWQAIRKDRASGYSVKRIARERGMSVAEVTAALTGRPSLDPEQMYDLRGLGRRLLKRCPPGRSKEEHERIVFANFCDVL